MWGARSARAAGAERRPHIGSAKRDGHDAIALAVPRDPSLRPACGVAPFRMTLLFGRL